MKAELFSLCDSAADYQGKLCVLGTFDTIWSDRMPLQYPQCAVALRLRFAQIEGEKHRVNISVINEDGKSILPALQSEVTVRFGEDSNSTAINLILFIQGMKFDNFGVYSVELAVDGRQEASLPLYLRKMEQSAKSLGQEPKQ